MKYPIIVLAGNRRQYLNYLKDTELSEQEAIFAESLDSLRSIHGSAVARVGSFTTVPGWQELESLALTRVGRFDAEWFGPYVECATRPQLEYLLTVALKGMCHVDQERLLDSIGKSPEWSGSKVSTQGN